MCVISYRGEGSSSGVKAEMCGSYVPEPILSEESVFSVKFITDYEFHYEGFRMYFSTVGNTTTPDMTSTTERLDIFNDLTWYKTVLKFYLKCNKKIFRMTSESQCSGQFSCNNGDCVSLNR